MTKFKYAFPLVDDYIYFDNSLVCVIALFIYSYLRSYSLGVKQLYNKVIIGKLCFMLTVEGIQIFFVAPVFASD